MSALHRRRELYQISAYTRCFVGLQRVIRMRIVFHIALSNTVLIIFYCILCSRIVVKAICVERFRYDSEMVY